jgi:hypothetical protein
MIRSLTLVIFFFILKTSCILAQSTKNISDGQVPQQVRNEFKNMRPAVKAHWQKVEDTMYVARFNYQKEKYIFWFQKDGQLYQQFKRLSLSDVPDAIRIYIYNTYPGISEQAFYSLTRGEEKFIYADIEYIQDKKVLRAEEAFPAPEDFLK